MSFRIRTALRTGGRQLSTAARTSTARAPRTGLYAVGTVLAGASLAIAFEYPKFLESFVVLADEAKIAETPARDQKEASRRTFTILLASD